MGEQQKNLDNAKVKLGPFELSVTTRRLCIALSILALISMSLAAAVVVYSAIKYGAVWW